MDVAAAGQDDGAGDAPNFNNVPSTARACVFDRMGVSFLRVAYWVETADGSGSMYWDLGHAFNRLCQDSGAASMSNGRNTLLREIKGFCASESHLENRNLHLRSSRWGWLKNNEIKSVLIN